MEHELEPEQVQLLSETIEEERALPGDFPRDMRFWFLFSGLSEGEVLQGPSGSQRNVAQFDLDELRLAGLIRNHRNSNEYVITPAGRKQYAHQRVHEEVPAESAEREVRRYLEGGTFAAAYPRASELWAQAQALLWGADSEQELTTVGHKAREATQAFATEVVERYKPDDPDPDPAKVNRRIGAVIAMKLPVLREARANLLKALGDYSEATMDVIQRQEHGAQKEGDPVTWHDASRVVLSVAMVMFELSAALEKAGKPNAL